MKVQQKKDEIPFVKDTASRAVLGGSQDVYGANSVQVFSSADPLWATHADADGFLNGGATSGTPANYWFKDGGVQIWQYEETYDNWQDTYGLDAVTAFFHSGHGVMDSNGVFYVPLGSKWDNRDWASSNRMSLGDEHAKYLFWSTCQSLRINGGQNPIKTWHGSNKGLRMIFGYETNSVDNPNYGRFFWEEWRKGKTFSAAFLDASWRISRYQSPVACACGATVEEVKARLWGERFFYNVPASSAWYWWTAYNAVAMAQPLTAAQLPRDLLLAEFEKSDAEANIKRVANLTGFGKKALDNVQMDARGNYFLTQKDLTLMVGNDGQFEAHLAKTNRDNMTQIESKKAQSIAEKLLGDHNLNRNVELKLTSVRYATAAGASSAGSGKKVDAHVVETDFEFRQVINGMPTINADSGFVRISVDNDGKVTKIQNTTKGILDLSPKSKTSAPDPANKAAHTSGLRLESDINKVQQAELMKILSQNNGTAKTIAGTQQIIADEVGYDVSKNYGKIVAQKTVELDMGKDLKKRYILNASIFE
jgi:hypothetical protein